MTQTKPPATSSVIGKWKPYPAYKNSGVEWLGEIPEHWEVWKIAHAFELIGSGTTPLSSNEKYYDGDIPWVNTAELRDGLIFDTSKKLTDKALLDYPILHIYPAGTLLVALYGATIGKVGLLQIPATTNQACCALSEPKQLTVSFTFYWLVAHRKQLILLASGGGQPNISQDTIRSLKIPAPSFLEQESITAFLNRETAKINTLIAKKERLIELLREKRCAFISYVVTKGLDPTVPMKDSGVEWLGEIPAHWKVKRLKYAAKLESGHTPNRSVPEYWENCTIPWVTLNDVGYLKEHAHIFETVNYINELGLANSSARLLPTGTVILSRDATVGRSGILDRPMATSQHFVDWICHEDLLPNYLLLVFRGPMQQEFERLTMGATLRTIGMPDVNSFRVPLPTILEQKQIVFYVEKATAKIDALISRIHEAIEKLKEYSTALISAAVMGKIDVREEIASQGLEA